MEEGGEAQPGQAQPFAFGGVCSLFLQPYVIGCTFKSDSAQCSHRSHESTARQFIMEPKVSM